MSAAGRLALGRRAVPGAAAPTLARPALAQSSGARTLRFVPTGNLALLGPVFSTVFVSINHGYTVFDTLYAVAASGAARPRMAERHEVSDDGRTWLVCLRECLRFHDGTPVRAADVVASILRWTARQPTGGVLRAGQRAHRPGAGSDRHAPQL